MKTSHTPTPWNYRVSQAQDGWRSAYCTITAKGDEVIDLSLALVESQCGYHKFDGKEGKSWVLPMEANAAHIVKCVNLHDEITAALEVLFNELLKAKKDSEALTPYHLHVNELIKRAKKETT